MPRFCNLAEQAIPTFCGIEFANGDLVHGTSCLKPGRNVLLGADTVLTGGLLLGFDAAILTTVNFCPELAVQCYDAVKKGKIDEAKVAQAKINQRVQNILSRGSGDWLETMKDEFNKVNPKLNAGPYRKPSLNVTKKQ